MGRMTRRRISGLGGMSLLGSSLSGWFPQLAAQVQQTGARPPRACILLWMSGGPSQLETFDPKEGHVNGGPGKAIETSVPGIRISENLPKVAAVMQHLAPIRSMTTKEGDHTRATYYLRTGYLPQGPIQYPCMGSFFSRELHAEDCDLPGFISISPFRAFSPAAYGPGFLGPALSPLVVESQAGADREISFEVQNLKPSVSGQPQRMETRLHLLSAFENRFLGQRPDAPGRSHVQSYERAVRMMNSASVDAFELEQEDVHDTLVFQVDLFSARGVLPRDMADVLARHKDIMYSSRTRNNTDTFRRLHNLRLKLNQALLRLPAEALTSEDKEYLASMEDVPQINIVHLIYQQKNYEGHAKDYEFSGTSMREHWESGYQDTRKTLRHRQWLEKPREAIGMTVHDVHRDDPS